MAIKVFSRIKRAYRKPMLFGAFAGLLIAVLAFGMTNRAQGVSFGADSAKDCDNNAVVWCGAQDTKKLISYYDSNKSVRDIYGSSFFNITSADVHKMNTSAVAGKVTKTGDVMVGNTVVATSAWTAGRQDISPSTKKTANGTTFYTRQPKVSFRSATLDAYVVMTNGKFDYAVIAACGNPVIATPKLPNDSITKQVQVKGTSTWSKSVTVKPGTHVNYQVVVSSTGQVAATNVTVSDKLPAHVTYVAGTLARDGKKVSDSTYFGSGLNLGTLNAGSKTVLTYEAVVGQNDTIENCVAGVLTNTANVVATGLPVKHDTANVSETCQPKTPNYTIAKEVQVKGSNTWSKSVDVKPGTSVNYRITVANTGNVTIKNILVKDQLPAHIDYTAGTLQQDGKKISDSQFFTTGTSVASLAASAKTVFTYSAVVGAKDTLAVCTNELLKNTASMTSTGLGGKQDSASVNKQCLPKPKYTCDGLTAANSGDRTSFTFVTKATIENAALKSVVYTVKDASGNVQNTISQTNLNPVSYTQAKEGNYTVQAVVTVTVEGKDVVAGGDCKASFIVKPVPVVPEYKCDKFIGTTVDGKKNTAKFVLSYVATGGAELTKVSVAWGDGATDGNVALTTLNNIVHTYAKAGTYNAEATLSFVVNGDTANVKTDTCAAPVTVTQPMCTVPGKEDLPADSDECYVPCPTDETIPASDTEKCTTPTPPVTPPETPTTLINTGPGDIVGMFAATSVAGTMAYRLVWARRYNS